MSSSRCAGSGALWTTSPCSSRTFALNLFAPLNAASIRGPFGPVGMAAVSAEGVVFEYSDALDPMAEARPGSPHRTQVDVLVRRQASASPR